MNRIGKAAAGLGAAVAFGAMTLTLAGPASAATTVTASTYVSNHPDTTSVSGGVCTSSPNGPVWADDFYTSTLTATQQSASTWQVQIHDSGTYVAFADPTTCAPLTSTGTLTGDYALTVTSAAAPTAAGLKVSYDGAISSTQMVLDFFGDAPASSDVVGGDYTFTYVGGGGTYTQNTTGSAGDVKAVACTVTVTKLAGQNDILAFDLNQPLSPNTAAAIVATSNYPGALHYAASNLPTGLSINPSTGFFTGSPTKLGTSVVNVSVLNTAYNNDTSAGCNGTMQFNWTIGSSPTPSSSHGTAAPAGGGTTQTPTGGVPTGGGLLSSSSFPWAPVSGSVLLAGLLLVGAAGIRRHGRQQE